MGKTKRLLSLVVKYLNSEGASSTTAIFEHINNTTRHGTTMQTLTNVLSKNPNHIQSVESTFTDSILGGRYQVQVWDTPHERKD